MENENVEFQHSSISISLRFDTYKVRAMCEPWEKK